MAWWDSLSVMEWLSFLSNWGVAILAVAVLVFGTRQSTLEGEQNERQKAEQQKEIAAINASAANANERAATLEKEAAEASERAAQLEKDAEEARLKHRQLEATVAWRDLTDAERERLRALLSKQPSSVRFTHIANDPESLFFTIKLSEAFRGWKIHTGVSINPDVLFFGVSITGTSSEEVELVRDAFRHTGIDFTDKAVPLRGIGIVGSADKEPGVQIVVGSKPRPAPEPKP